MRLRIPLTSSGHRRSPRREPQFTIWHYVYSHRIENLTNRRIVFRTNLHSVRQHDKVNKGRHARNWTLDYHIHTEATSMPNDPAAN